MLERGLPAKLTPRFFRQFASSFFASKRSYKVTVLLINDLHRPMIIAMIAMGVVQVAVDQVVDMIAMGHGFVAAAVTVNMVDVVTGAVVLWGAGVGVGLVYGEGVFVDMPVVGVMQVAVVQVIHVIIMLDGGVAAVRAVLMIVVFVVWF
jgi:hypothetical protein